jgi:predicted ester cyclase
MSTDENKAVVRRFITEVLEAGNLEVIDQLLATDYVNPGMGGVDRPGFKGMLAGLVAALPQRRFEIEDLVADGDAVVARFKFNMTTAAGETLSARGLTYYRLRNGQIIEDDPITNPDLKQLLAPFMPAPAHT